MAEVAFAQVEPDPLDRVQLGAVGRQPDERHVWWRGEGCNDVPAGLVHDHDHVFAGWQGRGELVQEDLHGVGVQLRQRQAESLASFRLHDGEQVCPGVALVAQARWALAAGEPTVANLAFLAETGFLLEPQGQALAGMGGADLVQFALQPLFAQTSRAAGSALGCDGRAFCRDRPRARTSLDICPSW